MNIKQIKERVRLIKLSNPNMDAYEILKKRNFVLGFIPTELQDEIPDGCYFKEGPFHFVLIHPELGRHESNLVYTHELGHATEHPDVNTMELEKYDSVFVDKIELEANTFASEFLLDDDVFLNNPDLTDEQLASKMNVLLMHVKLKRKNLDESKLPKNSSHESEYSTNYECNTNYECISDYEYIYGREYNCDLDHQIYT